MSMADAPICQECDVQMNPYSGREGDWEVAGYSCDTCGWSDDTDRMWVGEGPEPTPPKLSHAPSAEDLARRFHETYERLAPSFGYKTREASAKPWEEVPLDNRNLMIAVAGEIIEWWTP